MTWHVRVSDHALHQASGRAGIKSRRSIIDDVTAALAAGRVSAQRPAWLHQRANGRGLYVWTADERVAYVIAATDTGFVVLTALANEVAA